MNGQTGHIAIVNLPENIDIDLFIEKFKDVFEHACTYYGICDKNKIITILNCIKCNLAYNYEAYGIEQSNNHNIAIRFLDKIGFLSRIYNDFHEYHGMIINIGYRGD